MPDRRAALAALYEILTRADGKPARILERGAARAAETARAAVPDPGADLDIAHALGLYHWLRYLVLPEGRGEADLTAAAQYLMPIRLVSPEAVPEPLRRALDELAAGGPDTDMGTASLNNSATDMFAAYQRTGQHELLNQSLALLRAALAATPEDHPNRASFLSNLGAMLLALFERTGDRSVLAEAVQVGRQAVAATPENHPDRADHLSNLGDALRTLFERTGDRTALTEAVQVGRQAVAATPENHPGRAIHLRSLGIALQMLFKRTGQLSDLVEAVQVGRQAVAAIPEDRPDRATYLSYLGGTLLTLFERTGDRSALVEAVQVGRQAVAAAPEDHPERATYLSNLGITLQALFERNGQLSDLVEAVQVERQAVAAIPEDRPDRTIPLNNLGAALQLLSERTGDRSALVEAVQVGRQAVAATPEDHPERAARLNNLAVALWVLFERTGQLPELVEAVHVGRQAVAATPEDHPERAAHLSNLGASLQTLFKRSGQLPELVEGVQVGRQAVAATPEDHPDRATRLNNLGMALRTLFERTGEQNALVEARSCHRQVASGATGTTIARITAYRQLALVAGKAGDPQDGLRCAEAAIDLADTLAPGSLGRADRAFQLGRLAEIAGEAAATALHAGQPARAVELLERTRGILAADTLGLRGEDQTRLRAHVPELADRLEQLRNRLDALDQPRRVPHADFGTVDAAQHIPDSGHRLADQRHEAYDAWQSLLEEIRALPGFADFFRAPPIDALACHAHDGPIVFVTTSPTRCDALILTDSPDPVQVVPLTGLTDDSAYDQAKRLFVACRTASSSDVDPAARQAAQGEVLAILAWLWDTIAEPVLTHLGHTTTPVGDAPWPRIWWCPVGALAYMPLHAAGHHTRHQAQPARLRTVPDLVVSSYTLTVRALAHARTRRGGTGIPTTLIVPVPDIPGAELPDVSTETAAITTLIPEARTLRHPTRDTVLRALPEHRITHFSCHAYSDGNQPAASRLILNDHATTPLTLADITPLNLDADLAYLSACTTTITTLRLADESLHITGAFHLAGYRHVIGTLWPIDDGAAARIATDFYAHLTTDGTTPPQPARAAQALHHATTYLRTRYPTTPTLWAAHTHTGA
jgi:CHAT domain/Tetratricopeptide repeat